MSLMVEFLIKRITTTKSMLTKPRLFMGYMTVMMVMTIFVVDNGETNGTRVDFTAGIQGELN